MGKVPCPALRSCSSCNARQQDGYADDDARRSRQPNRKTSSGIMNSPPATPSRLLSSCRSAHPPRSRRGMPLVAAHKDSRAVSERSLLSRNPHGQRRTRLDAPRPIPQNPALPLSGRELQSMRCWSALRVAARIAKCNINPPITKSVRRIMRFV
jgi:hypothetical protein